MSDNNEKLCYIIPFRERYNNLKDILDGLIILQKETTLKIDVYVINQSNNYLFNKGILFNSGFIEIGKNYKLICMGDCDCIPISDNNRIDKNELSKKYSYTNFSFVNEVSHLASFVEQWDFVIEDGDKNKNGILCSDIDFLKTEHSGGCLLFNSNFYKEINGFSNNYFGWGGEDCDNGYRIMHYMRNRTNEIIKYIQDNINNNIQKNIIKEDIENLPNIEYSIYRFLLLIFNSFNETEINKVDFLQKVLSYNYEFPHYISSNSKKYKYKLLPGLLLNRRPGMFNDSKHANKERSKSQHSTSSKNPNYNNNVNILNKLRELFYNENDQIHNFIQCDGLSNIKDNYELISKEKYEYKGINLNVFNIDTPKTMFKKISIVMAYINRKSQLLNTLNSFKNSNYPSDLIEVVIVDDGSVIIHQLDDIIYDYNFTIKLIKTKDKKHINPCIPYNMGFSACSGEIIIIQNPECAHVGDIISYAAKYSNDTNYLVLPCFTTINEEQNNQIKEYLNNKDDYEKNIKIMINKLQGTYLHEWNGWYIHEEYNKRYLHFCSIISKNNLDKLNGFDERYGVGLWADDDEIYERINMICDCSIVDVEKLLVLHQHHVSITGIEQGMIPDEDKEKEKKKLIEKNMNLLNELKTKIKNNYKDPNWLNFNNATEECISYYGQIHYKQKN